MSVNTLFIVLTVILLIVVVVYLYGSKKGKEKGGLNLTQTPKDTLVDKENDEQL